MLVFCQNDLLFEAAAAFASPEVGCYRLVWVHEDLNGNTHNQERAPVRGAAHLEPIKTCHHRPGA